MRPAAKIFRFLGLLAVLASGAIETAHALPWPLDDAVGPFRIGGVLGEYRDTGATDHFHDGVDVSTTAGANVRASLAGTLNAFCNTCGVDNYIEVKTGTSRYIYYHVDPTVTTLNTPITLGQLIGNVHSQTGPHVHLEQLDGLAQDVNTLLNPGFANYVDTSSPSVSGVGFYDANTGPDAAPIDISSPTTKDYLRIRAKEFDRQSLGSQNVGIFSTGYKVFNNATNALVIDNSIQQSYASFAENVTNSPQIAYDSTTSTTSDYYYFANNWITMAQPLNLQNYPDASYKICVVAKDMKGNGGNTVTQVGAECKTYRLDRTAPTEGLLDGNGASLYNGGASSMTTITVTSTDTFGMKQIAISGPTSDSRNVTGLTATETFTGLSDGQYTATVTDLAGNQASNIFAIKTTGAATGNKDSAGEVLPNVFSSTYCPAGTAIDSTGIASITISSTGFSDATAFDCTPAKISTDAVGHGLCGLPSGSYTTTSVNCAGVTSSTTSTITSGTNLGYVCLGGTCAGFAPTAGSSVTIVVNTAGACGGCSLDFFCKSVVLSPLTSCHTSGGGLPFVAEYTGSCQKGLGFTLSNSTNTRWTTALQITAGAGNTGFLNDVGAPLVSETLNGTVTMPEVNSLCPESNAANTATVRASYWDLLPTQADMLGALLATVIRQVLAYVPGTLNAVFGSDVVLTSSGTLMISIPNPSSILVSTQTLAIYRFDGVDWSSAAVTNQIVSKDTTTSVISATGSIITSGYYALLFLANDSSAPITTFAIQGSSFNFDGATFVSTDAFVVLTATDPVVNGYASTVASITYRIDPSSGSAFYIYSSSIPLPLGTHVFEYRSLDFAGNTEVVHTATFTVTAGTAFRTTNTAQVPGVLLNGFLGSGAKLEIESQAQNSLTLLISSVNRQGMVAVDNIGEVGIGVTPQANLNIGAGAVALQLRSGNSTSSVTSDQIAFGYNGDYSMRHLLRTEHSTSTDGNKMDFLVWNTGAASTTTVASLDVLSLQGIATASGGSFHVQPVGEPDAEVEVSNGLSTGGGTMQRLQVVSPSSRRFKTDIKDLSAKDEDRALEDVAGLKHANFRYMTRRKDGRLIEDPAQPLRTGLIYEEAPDSIRDGAQALSTTERLVNVEMALKAAMRRLEELQARHDKLKARRKP